MSPATSWLICPHNLAPIDRSIRWDATTNKEERRAAVNSLPFPTVQLIGVTVAIVVVVVVVTVAIVAVAVVAVAVAAAVVATERAVG